MLVVMMSSNGSEVNCFSIDSDGHILSTEHVQTVSTSTKNYLEDNTVLCRLLTSMPLCVLQDQPGRCASYCELNIIDDFCSG